MFSSFAAHSHGLLWPRAVTAEAGQALAPSPSEEATRQAADGSFTLGPVANATLLNSTFLRMEGVPATVSWLQFSPTHTAGTLATVSPLHTLTDLKTFVLTCVHTSPEETALLLHAQVASA